jgi:hypothetical protein
MVLTLLERLYIYGRDGTFSSLASLSLSHIRCLGTPSSEIAMPMSMSMILDKENFLGSSGGS